MNAADARAGLAAAQDAAAQTPVVTLMGTPPEGTPEGFSAWSVGPLFGPRHVVVLPSLAEDAPSEMWDRLVARVLATATGLCPMCGQAAGLLGPAIPDPEQPMRGRAAYYSPAFPLTVGIRHDAGCPAAFDDPAEARWFPVLNRKEQP